MEETKSVPMEKHEFKSRYWSKLIVFFWGFPDYRESDARINLIDLPIISCFSNEEFLNEFLLNQINPVFTEEKHEFKNCINQNW